MQVRLSDDVAEMVREAAERDGVSAAQVVDRLLRPTLRATQITAANHASVHHATGTIGRARRRR